MKHKTCCKCGGDCKGFYSSVIYFDDDDNRHEKDFLCYTCHRHEFRQAGGTRGGQEIKQDQRKEAQNSERRELIALGGRTQPEHIIQNNQFHNYF